MENKERTMVLQYIQPGLLGLMDGSVSTLAPLFAVAFATKLTHVTLLVGLSAAIGAAISMGFAEALSDTGIHTGRGNPLKRGLVTGLMTFLGGILHAIPFLLPNIWTALYLAFIVVGVELSIIAYIRNRYFKMNFLLSITQVVVGGILVIAAGILIGNA